MQELIDKIEKWIVMAEYDMKICEDVRADNGYKIAKARRDAYQKVLDELR